MKFKKGVALILLVLMGVTNIPFDFLARSVGKYFENKNIVDVAWRASIDSNVVDNFTALGKRLTLLRTPEVYAAVGDARIKYGQSTNAAPWTSFYTTSSNSWGTGATTGVAGTANVGWTVAKESPTEDVTVVATQSSTGKLDIFCRTGTTWTKDIANVTVGTTAATRRLDVEFEKTSGIPMVLYSTNTATTNELSYYRKTGAGCGAGSWTGPTTLNPTVVTGIVLWVELEARQTSGSNVLAAAFSDANATQGGKLEAMIWNGSSWGNESPAGAVQGWSDLSIELQGTAGANAAKVFDLAFETNTGDLFIAWGTSTGANGTNGWRYATCSATLPCTWSGVLTPAGPLDDATNVACAPDPGSDAIACLAQGNGGADLSAWTWSGTAVGATTAATADATLLATAAGDMHVDIDWVVNGTQRMAVGVYAETTTGVRYIYYDTVGAAWRTNTTTSFTPTGAPTTALQSVQVLRNPSDLTKLLVLLTDANSDLISLRLNYNGAAGGATTALSTWNASTGSPIELTVSSITSQPFWFDWVKVAPATVTTLGSGTDPGSTTIAPEASITDAGQLTFQTNTGTDSITQLNVTLAGSGTPYDGVSEVRITSSDGVTTYYSAIANPTSNSLVFSGGTPIPVSTGSATFKIRITPKTHTNMPAVPGTSYALSPYVSNWTGTNTHAGSDSNANTLTIDNLSPNGATSVSGSAGNAAVTINWTTSNSGDFNTTSGSVIYRWASGTAGSEVPTEGSTPTTGGANGTATVACVVSSAASTPLSKIDGTGGSAECTTSALTNGQTYTYKAFQKDTNGNYDAGVAIGSFTPTAPANVTTIADGTNPGNSTVAPSSSITDLDAFTLSTNAGTDSVTALTVTLTGANSFESLSEMRITSSDGVTTYFSAVSNPSSNTVNFSLGTAIPVSTTATTFKVRITPKTHANMPIPPGLSYAVGGTVTAFTSTNTQSGTDSGSATITVDNLSPNGATLVSGSAGDTAVTINWTTSNSGDFNTTSGSVIYRWASGTAGSEVPTEGSTPTTGSTNGTATVACVISSAASSAQSKVDGTGGSVGCTTTALTNGQAYTYKAFQKDTNGNYDAGVSIGTFTPARILTIGVTAAAKPVAVSSGLTSRMVNSTTCTGPSSCAAFTLSLNSGSETVTSIKITEIGTVDATNNLSNLALFYDTDGNWSDAGAETQYGSTVAAFTSEAATVSGSLAITAGTTYYFYVRIDLVKAGTYPSGGQGIDFQVAANGDVTVSGSSTKTGAPVTLTSAASTCATTSHTCVRPDATGTTYGSGLADGARSGESITISGYGFGTAPGGSRANCTGAVNTGCVKFIVGGNATVADANISAWSNTSITLTINNLASYGGVSSIEVNAGNINDTTALTFYIYPNINQIITPSVSNAAQEAENITLTNSTASSARFGATQGTVDFVGGFGTVSATIVSWGDTSVQVTVPTAISNSIYLGDIILTRAADTNSKTDLAYDSNGFRILPRITGNSPISGLVGDTVQLAGDHFCQTGTCPVSPNRSSATDNVKFGSTQAADGDFQNLTGGAGVCNGTGAAWNHSEICVKVPTGTPINSQPTIIKSNSYDSNTQAFTVNSATPSDPTLLDQFKDVGLTQSIAVGGTASATPIYLKQTMEVSGVSGGTLYPQFEYQLTGTAFVCGAGACGSAVEGTGGSGPGPATGSKSISPADGTYHWQARTRHNKNSVDYYSNWVSFGGNGDPSGLDFKIDTVAPSITSGPSSNNIGSNSTTIVWDTLSETSTSRVEYNKTGVFTGGYNCAGTNECTALDSNLVNTHSVGLSNLDSGTLYYYRVRSMDVTGNETGATGATGSFQTNTVSEPIKTTQLFIVASTTAITSATTTYFTIPVTETSPKVKSSYVELTGLVTGGTGLRVQVNSASSKDYSVGATNPTNFKILYRIVSDQTSVLPNDTLLNFNDSAPCTNGNLGSAPCNKLIITPLGGLSIDNISARLIMTYGYTP